MTYACTCCCSCCAREAGACCTPRSGSDATALADHLSAAGAFFMHRAVDGWAMDGLRRSV